jgi:hypothetical protein
MPVELRAVLDQAEWNAPFPNFFYDFINGRRTWILRDAITGKQSYEGVLTVTFPALITSKGGKSCAAGLSRPISSKGWGCHQRGVRSVGTIPYAIGPTGQSGVLESVAFARSPKVPG